MVVGPGLASPGRHLVGNPLADVWNHAWGPWWWWHALSNGQLPWRTELLHAPVGGVLWFIDPILGLLGAPLVPLLGPAAAFDLALLLMVAFASWAAARFARSLGASPGAAWLASAGFAASAWVVSELHNGITEAVDIGPVALALAWGEDACRDRSIASWTKAGLGIGLATLASPYLGLGAGIVLAVRGLHQAHLAWAGALVAGVIGGVPLLLLRAQLESVDAIVRRPGDMNDSLAAHNAVDPRTFLWPNGFQSVDLSAEGMHHSMYLGGFLLLLVGVALVSRPRRSLPWLLAAAVGIIAALGPYLFHDGAWILGADGQRVALPWLLLQDAVPGLAVTHPLRLAVAPLAVLAGLAALGGHRLLGRRAVLLLPLLLVDGLFISGAPWPVATSDARLPPVFDDLRARPGDPDWIILDLPTDVGQTMATSRYLFWQTGHHRPIPYAVDARASTNILLGRPAFRDLAATSRRRDDESRRLGLLDQGRTDLAELAEVGVRWIVLHRELDPEIAGLLEARIVADLGPGEEIGDAVRWDLGEDATAYPTHLERLRAGRAAGAPSESGR